MGPAVKGGASLELKSMWEPGAVSTKGRAFLGEAAMEAGKATSEDRRSAGWSQVRNPQEQSPGP